MKWIIGALILLVIAALVWMLLRRPSGAVGSGSGGSTDQARRDDADTDAGWVPPGQAGYAGGTGAVAAGSAGAVGGSGAASGRVYDQTADDQAYTGATPTYDDSGRGGAMGVGAGAGATAAGATAAGGDASTQGDEGHPGPDSQRAGEATYTDDGTFTDDRRHAAPVPTADDARGDSDQGHPGPGSQGTDDTTQDTTQDTDDTGYDTSRGASSSGAHVAGLTDAAPTSDQGHPGSDSQQGRDASYGSGGSQGPSNEPGYDTSHDTTRGATDSGAQVPDLTAAGHASDQGHPGPSSQRAGEATYTPETDRGDDVPHGTDEGWQDRETGAGDTTTRASGDSDGSGDYGYDEAHAGAAASGGFGPGPYGPGSAVPAADGSGPSGWSIKGNAGSMLYHTPESPSYDNARAEVWFESEEAARSAGFAHWDRKQR